MDKKQIDTNGIAVIGMAGQFPKAKDIESYWNNIIDGKECISFFTDEELREAGIDENLFHNPHYVKAKGVLEGMDLFDADFFKINPNEAKLTDPQHRLLLEGAWCALEHAGYASYTYDGSIGVYAGCAMNSYMLLNVYPYIKKEVSAGTLIAAIGNDKDSLTTNIAYRMNLSGPAVTVQSSSSTSLVASSLACQSLLTYQCDMAIAGGIAVGPPSVGGYLYQEGGIMSPDGHCRAFDKQANGFVPGMGYGLVVLKRLSDAIEDRDYIWAVIKGFAVNNDGYDKVSYSAPSVTKQSEVIVEAQTIAGISPDTITYIETHGTGTNLGDPIEIAALTEAFRMGTNKKQYCAIGSVKTNIGHLDTAGGVAGLIKTCMALKNKTLPPSLHYNEPNPNIDFATSPFYVNTEAKYWESGDFPRRAGVSSIGMGGTNAHMILEEYDNNADKIHAMDNKPCILMLSAKTPKALDNYTNNLMAYLCSNKDNRLEDVAYTLAVGRNEFEYRQALICSSGKEYIEAIENKSKEIYTGIQHKEKKIAFMFTGQGSQYSKMGQDLYMRYELYKSTFDLCADLYKKYSGEDLRDIIYRDNTNLVKQTQFSQPALFAFEYALAKLLMSWGLDPHAMIGHSLGEYVAACIAGVISLDDCIKMIHYRSFLMQKQVKGSMMVVAANEDALKEWIIPYKQSLCLAAVNGPNLCVVSGEDESIMSLRNKLLKEDIFCRKLVTSHAFHSMMMEPMMEEYAEIIKDITFKKPQIPYISSVTGKWITDDEVMNIEYWVNQIRATVRFSYGVQELLKEENTVILEVGPGNSLTTIVKQHLCTDSNQQVIASVDALNGKRSSIEALMKAVAQLWTAGITILWEAFYKDKTYYRLPLPTYPFERKSYWYGKDENTAISSDDTKEVTEEYVDQHFQPRPTLQNDYIPPVSEMEKEITKIVEELLGINGIGIEDDFFELGGHSLLATQVLSRIYYKFQVKISLKDIFYNFTIKEMVRIMQENDGVSRTN
ncbi:type I polyketide synthase [Vallitalea maricola]|uniref:Uncharacterized protein n=1 Tax=Vallitalea maricola TaxID=3074433 RepID=A0ACB5UJ41_9FIRM|nr:hypothetical protein AN2V17_22060 [Vallitalea sp. AN17-2]